MKPPVSVRRTVPFRIFSKPAVHHEVLRFLRLSPLLSRRRRISLSTSPKLIGLNECGIRQQRSGTLCGLLPDLRGGTELEVMVFQYSSAPDETTHSRGGGTMIALSLIRGSAPIALRSYRVGRLSSFVRCGSSGEKLWPLVREQRMYPRGRFQAYLHEYLAQQKTTRSSLRAVTMTGSQRK